MTLTNSLKFLSELALHNSKEWMDANRDWYQQVRQEFITFVEALIREMQEFEPGVAGLQAKNCIFRINRDIRFSANKSPYKTNFGAAISEAGRHTENPLYYFHLQPGESFLGGGMYMPGAESLKKIRQEIDYNPEELKRIIENPVFATRYGALQGEQLKTAPKGYPKDHPNIELLKLKSFIAIHPVSDEQATNDGILGLALDSFRVLKPFKEYLSVAVS